MVSVVVSAIFVVAAGFVVGPRTLPMTWSLEVRRGWRLLTASEPKSYARAHYPNTLFKGCDGPCLRIQLRLGGYGAAVELIHADAMTIAALGGHLRDLRVDVSEIVAYLVLLGGGRRGRLAG